MKKTSAIWGFIVAAALGSVGCGGSDSVVSPIGQWCTDPGRDASGNTVLTLVKKPDATLPPRFTAQFNDQTPVEFVDDGTGLDQKAGDGIYTHSAKLMTAPTTHECRPVQEGKSSQSLLTSASSETGALAQGVEFSGSCSIVSCPKNCRTLLGGSCYVCFTCELTITF